jgi:hypothetical protein
MELEMPNEPRSRRKRGPWIEVTLISGFIFSLLVGIGALAALLASSRGEETTLATAATQTISPERIVPQLALAQLAGDPAEALAYQAAAAGELDTASAIALTDAELPGPKRLSLLMRLGERFNTADRPPEAAVHYNLARAVAVLEPYLDGVERTAALTRSAEGFLVSGEDDAALEAAIQAVRVAEQTPGMLPTHRSQAYENLRPLAIELGDEAFQQELAELSRNPFYEPPGVAVSSALPELWKPVPFDDEVRAAISAREQAARVLADRILLTQGIDIGPELQELATSLMREDQVRESYYRRVLGEGLTLEDQYALLLDRRAWIALKARIALQGFGLSIVPEWEQNFDGLRSDLGVATANVGQVADAMANELADPFIQAMLRIESLLWSAQQAELDLYPGISMDDLNVRMLAAQQELARLGSPLALPVTYEENAAPPGFRIQRTR